MLRATGRAVARVPARLSGLGPQAVVASVGGAVAAAALVVASTSGVAHPEHVIGASRDDCCDYRFCHHSPARAAGGCLPRQRGTANAAPQVRRRVRNYYLCANSAASEPVTSGRGPEGDASTSSDPAGRDELHDPTTGGNAGGDLVKQVRKVTSGVPGVVGDVETARLGPRRMPLARPSKMPSAQPRTACRTPRATSGPPPLECRGCWAETLTTSLRP